MSDPHESGQDTQPRYAELDPNTAPQVYFGGAPEVFAPIQPDVVYERQAGAPAPISEEIKDESPKGFWAKLGKRKTMWLVGLAVAICIILAIGISVPLAGDTVSRSSKAGRNGASSLSASPTRADEAMPTNPTATEVPGCERDRYTPNADWVGIRDGSGWDFQLKTLDSVEGCCGYCFERAKECNAWLYAPAKGLGPDCTLILGYEGDDADDECPNGRPDVIFNVEDDKSRNMAGSGPCSGSAERG